MDVIDPGDTSFLNDFAKIRNPRILESDFRDKVLPTWVANVGKPMSEQDQSGTEHYLSIVRNEFARVDVMDDETGEFLFWVPPLKHNCDLTDIDVIGLHKKANAYRDVSAKVYIDAMNKLCMKATENKTIPQEEIDQFAMIYARYGYTKKNGEEVKVKEGNGAAGDGNKGITTTTEDDNW